MPQTCKFIAIDIETDLAGERYALADSEPLPFAPVRIHVLSDFPRDAIRDCAALDHDQVVVLLAGQARVEAQSEQRADRFDLSDTGYALHVPAGHSLTLTAGAQEPMLMILGAAPLPAGPAGDLYLAGAED